MIKQSKPNTNENKQLIKGKRQARKVIVQAFYQWLMSDQEIAVIEEQFLQAGKLRKVDVDYFRRILYGVPKHLEVLEKSFTPFLDRAIAELNPVELSVIRLGAFELMFCPEIPYKVVLDEAVTLTKEFGSQDGHRYVNGVLNNLARQIRSVEINNHE